MKRGYLVLLVAVFLIVIVHGLLRSSCSSASYNVVGNVDSSSVDSPNFRTRDARNARKYTKKRAKIELNTADSSALVSVYGIGPVFCSRIIQYRQNLGGFYTVGQLKEVRGISDEVFEQIKTNFVVDSTKIQKINVNFADRKQLEDHPYITPSMARRVVQGRMKGGFFKNSKQLIDLNILLPKEAQKATPYLSFKQI